jgi:hypothetical protein
MGRRDLHGAGMGQRDTETGDCAFAPCAVPTSAKIPFVLFVAAFCLAGSESQMVTRAFLQRRNDRMADLFAVIAVMLYNYSVLILR